MQADIGLIGLAVMGQNLALNFADHGYDIAVYNRTQSKIDAFLQGPAQGSRCIGSHSLEEFVGMLKRPRRILLMVKAGDPVDALIQQCLPLLEPGDILIDGGNSRFTDTTRRTEELREKGVLFVGLGVSGGEEGARHGPSLMPGGNAEAWPFLRDMLRDVAAKAESGEPCCDWVGLQGAGHYVKMVHNGIEYGDMQLICEAYDLLQQVLGLSAAELEKVFHEWNQGPLDSYLIQITSSIFGCRDEEGEPVVDKILDVAGQKGTGRWTVMNALDLGMPVTLIGEAVFARALSTRKEEREEASKRLPGPPAFRFEGDRKSFIEKVRQALYAAKIISYAQGFMLMRQASEEFSWSLNYGAIAMMWREGCIIRSRFLDKIKEAFDADPLLKNLLTQDFFREEVSAAQGAWRDVVSTAVQAGVPTPCFSTALAFYDGYRTARLPANLLQAQRDFFGAHTYERIDSPRGEFFHTQWETQGGLVETMAVH